MTTTAVEAIAKNTDPNCHARRCRNSGCSLSLTGLPRRRILIDLEHDASPVPRNEPHCDFILVADHNGNSEWVAPIELTTGRAEAAKFIRQLTAGAAIADRLLPGDVHISFRPVAAYGGQMRRADRVNLLNPANRVTFRGQRESIRVVRCESPLLKALTG